MLMTEKNEMIVEKVALNNTLNEITEKHSK